MNTILLNHTLTLKDDTPVNIIGGQLDESGDLLLKLDEQSKRTLTQVCGFTIHRAFIISVNGFDCSLYAERQGADKIPICADENDYFRVFLFQNELEALGLYTLAQSMA